jgi:sialidase-1
MNLKQEHIWTSGRDGYHTYRIPALAVTCAGTVLAFCEGRADGMGDTGRIDMLLKRSTDGGRTWSPASIVWSDGHTCGNPCPVVDRKTGTIWLLMTWNRHDDPQRAIEAGTSKDTRRAFVTSSRDDGLTWDKPREITADVKPAEWTWYATGPGAGIQLTRGAHAGRLVAPCDHRRAPGDPWMGAHIVYSDDGGASWRLGGITPGGGVNECEAVELADGSVMLNMRNYTRTTAARQVSVSADGGLTWGPQRFDAALPEPVCQAAIHRHTWPAGGTPGVILFSNPASGTDRVNMTVRASLDEGATWAAAKVLEPGFSAYSDLAVLPDGTILCLYESGAERKYGALTLARFGLDWLLG